MYGNILKIKLVEQNDSFILKLTCSGSDPSENIGSGSENLERKKDPFLTCKNLATLIINLINNIYLKKKRLVDKFLVVVNIRFYYKLLIPLFGHNPDPSLY